MRKRFSLVFAGLLLSLGASANPIFVNMDTSSLVGFAGSVDVQFNPGATPGSEPGTATVTQFTVNGGTFLVTEIPGSRLNATGDLPGPLVITNADFLNGITYGDLSLGSSVTFTLQFAGNAFTAAGQTILNDFSLSLITDIETITARVSLLGDSLYDTSQSSPGVTFSTGSAEIPEPATIGLMAGGLALAFLARKRR